jgi:exonuclease SbcD
MLMLHTSDLHYGHVGREINRLPDQNRVLDEILALCEARNVQLLLVAGDVFSNRLGSTSAASVARQLLTKLAPHLERGLAVFLLYGNHDNLPLFQLMRTFTAEMAGGAGRWPLVIADRAAVYDVPGLPHAVIALPYLTQRSLLNQSVELGLSPEEQAAILSGQISPRLRQLYALAPEGRPAIFTTHFLVEGFTLDTDESATFESYHHDLRISPQDLPHFTSYNALGHIHLQQQIKSAAKPTWYSGAPDRLDAGERAYRPGVLLVDVPDSPGGTARVEIVPTQASTPFVKELLDGEDAVDRFCWEIATPLLLGEVTVSGIPASGWAAVQARLREAAPRVRLLWATARPATAASSTAWADPNNPLAIVQAHLAEHYKEQPAQRDRLLEAFTQLLAAEDVSEAEVSA